MKPCKPSTQTSEAMTRIFAFHLLNDYSGSPKVLGQLLKGWADQYRVHLYTSDSTPGFLSGIDGIRYHSNFYRFHQFIPLRLLVLLFSQLFALGSLLFRVKREDVVYINTILPFGAAIAGRIRGARVIYHIHETSINPKVFKQFLLFWVKACATEVIYVSDFLASEEPLDKPRHILWNAIEDEFRNKAAAHRRADGQLSNVLMLASLKKYKGVDEFVVIAEACPELQFELVANAAEQDIAAYFGERKLPENLTIYPAQGDVHPFYQRADVVMNLSRPEEWKETFGLTALEAMIYGLPVIVPPVGGIAEIVMDGQTGFHLNGKDTPAIVSTLRALKADPHRYRSISEAAAAHATTFSESHFLAQNLQLIERPAYPECRVGFQNVE